MRAVYLGKGSELAQHCGAESLELEVSSPAEAVRAIVQEYPGARQVIERGNWMIRDGETWAASDWALATTREGAPLYIVPAGEGGNEGIGKIFAGIFLIGIGILTGGTFLTALPSIFVSGSSYIGIGAVVALSGVARLMSPTPGANPMDLEEASARQSGLFSNPTTISAAGEPVPLIYGETLTGALRVSSLAYSSRDLTTPSSVDLVSSVDVEYVDVISEGEVEGLVGDRSGVYFDGVSIVGNESGDSSEGIAIAEHHGAGYPILDGVGVSSRITPINRLVSSATDVVLSITDPEVDRALVTLEWPILVASPNNAATVEYTVQVDAGSSGTWQDAKAALSFVEPATHTEFRWISQYTSPPPYPGAKTATTGVSGYAEMYRVDFRLNLLAVIATGSTPPPWTQVILYWKDSADPNYNFEALYPTPWLSQSGGGSNYWHYTIEYRLTIPAGITSIDFFMAEGPGTQVTPTWFEAQLTHFGIAKGEQSGRALSGFSTDVDLPDLSQYGASPYLIKFDRTTADQAAGSLTRDEFKISRQAEIKSHSLEHSDSALITVRGNMAEAFGTVSPAITYLVRGIKCAIPDGYDPVAGTFSSPWNGTFKAAAEYTNDPAWILYDLLTAPYGLNLDPARIDKWSFAAASRRNLESVAELVTAGALERRYTWNGAITRSDDGYKIASQIAAAMDAQLWVSTGGEVYLGQDRPGEVARLFTGQNVIDGLFTYEGSAIDARRTSVSVNFRDSNNGFEADSIRADRPFGVNRFGDNPLELDAPGVTSRGQAIRRARYVLLSDELENQTVRFSVGLESALVAPGEIIEIADPNRFGVMAGARLTSSILLGPDNIYLQPAWADFTPQYTPNVSLFHFTTEDGVVVTGTIYLVYFGVVFCDNLSLASPVPAEGSAMLMSSSPSVTQWRVLEVTDDGGGLYSVLAVQYEPDKWTAIENASDIGEPYPFPAETWPPS